MIPFVALLVLAAGLKGLGGAQIPEAKRIRIVLDGFGEVNVPREWRYANEKNWDSKLKIWKNRTLVFSMDGAVLNKLERSVIYEGIEELSTRTCVTFQERRDEIVYVNITGVDSSCYFSIGEPGDVQVLNLDHTCVFKYIVIHELMHALGFSHEQRRPIRNDYVTINATNIIRKYLGNFSRLSSEAEEIADLPYDYDSIMHYKMYAFAIDPTIPTIIPKRPNVTLGGEELTPTDVLKVERLYKCRG